MRVLLLTDSVTDNTIAELSNTDLHPQKGDYITLNSLTYSIDYIIHSIDRSYSQAFVTQTMLSKEKQGETEQGVIN